MAIISTLDLDGSPTGTTISLCQDECGHCPPFLLVTDKQCPQGVVISALNWEELEEWLMPILARKAI